MNIKNYCIYNTDMEELKRLQEEYQFLGKKVKLEEGKLTVFARVPKREKKKKEERRK